MGNLIKDCIKLGFGMMRLPRVKEDGKNVIDVEQTKDMVDAFLAAGGKYIDTAFVYEGSEEATRKALVERYPRDAYYLATKLNASEHAAKNEEEAKQEFQPALREQGPDTSTSTCSTRWEEEMWKSMINTASGTM